MIKHGWYSQKKDKKDISKISTHVMFIFSVFSLPECGPFPTWLNIKQHKVYFDTVEYDCDEGFSFSDDGGHKTSTCNFYGIWEPSFQPCEGVVTSDYKESNT